MPDEDPIILTIEQTIGRFNVRLIEVRPSARKCATVIDGVCGSAGSRP